MAIEKIIDLQINTNAEQAVGSLRNQLKIAQADVAALSEKFGATSNEAINAAKRAGELKDKIGDAKALTDAFNPDAKFKALSSSLSGVAGGFAAVQGGMALFGSQSEDVEKTLLKVQSAMALSTGLQAVGESVDSFKQLGAVVKSYSIVQKVLTAGQWLWNAAMSANPIGAIIVAITALIAAGYALTKYFMDNAEASEKNAKALKNDTKALNDQIKTAEKNTEAIDINSKQKLAMAKASGKSAEEIRKLELKLADEKIAFERSSREIAKNTYYKNLNILATLKAAGASDEEIKSREDVTNASLKEFSKENKNLTTAVKEKAAIINRHQVEVRTDETKHRTKLTDDATAAKTKEAADAEARQKKDADDLKAALEAKKAAELSNRDEVAKAIEEASEKQSIANLTASEAEQRIVKDKYFGLIELAKQQNKSQEEIDILETQRKTEIKSIENKFRLEDDAKKATELEKTIKDKDSSFEIKLAAIDAEQALYQKQFDDKVITEEAFNEKTKVLSESRSEINKLEAEKREAWLRAGSAALKNAASVLGESTDAGKAAAIAAATIETYQSAVSSYNSLSGIPIVGPALGAVAAGFAVATGVMNVKKILAVKTPKGGGGGSAPSGGAPSAPSFNVVGASGTNQLAQSIGAQKQEPIKAYVTAGDVTSGQSLNRNIIQNASMG